VEVVRGAAGWSSADGIGFAPVVDDLGEHDGGVPISTSFTALAVSSISGQPELYAGMTGTGGYGGRLLAFDETGATRWVVDDAADADSVGLDEAGMGRGDNQQISSIAEFGGRLWLATLDFKGLELF